MDKKYLKYTLEDLFDDKQFVAWVLKGYKDKEWSIFINDHPEIKARANKARGIIQLLKDTYDVLDEESVLLMWQNIGEFNKSYKYKARSVKLFRTFKAAASVLIIISLGILGYIYLNNRNIDYEFVSSNTTRIQDEAYLKLSDGEEIALKKDKSTIVLNNDKEIVINDESTINLSEKVAKDLNSVQMNEVVVPYGKSSELLLADGTKVWLNAGSRLAFPTKFTNNTREVYLEGEACFKVIENKSQPFIVNANKLRIKVLGTYFDVAAYPDDEIIETILVEGSVELAQKTSFGLNKKSLVLKPNQKATFNKEEKVITVIDEPEADVYLAWTEGWFQFTQKNLNVIFTKLERYYSIEIIVPENFPTNEKITGKLDLKDSLEEVLKALSDVAKIDYKIINNQILINKKDVEIPIK